MIMEDIYRTKDLGDMDKKIQAILRRELERKEEQNLVGYS